jgi:hypothetical protein
MLVSQLQLTKWQVTLVLNRVDKVRVRCIPLGRELQPQLLRHTRIYVAGCSSVIFSEPTGSTSPSNPRAPICYSAKVRVNSRAGSTSRLQRQTNRDSTIRHCPTRAKPRHILNWLKMASGYGMNGGKSIKAASTPRTTSQTYLRLTTSTWALGVGRCFPFWQEVMGCYVVNTTAADDSGKKKCGLVLEDYYECLHHKKEVGFKHADSTLLSA